MPLTFVFWEDILERRKDMLYKKDIIPQIPPAASKIIKNYSKFPKNTACDLKTVLFAPLNFSQWGANPCKLLAGAPGICLFYAERLKFYHDSAEERLAYRCAIPTTLYVKS
jgi:hypothetical protein